MKNKKILYAILVTAGFLSAGTIGYVVIEHYPPLDALYMTVITISTVGFGEIQTLSSAGRVFTIFLILFGFGSVAFLAHSFTEAIIERASNQNLGRKTMLQKVQQLSKHHIICGFGRVGESAAERFHAVGAKFVIIESGEEQIKRIQELGYLYIEGDATKEESLLEAGIKKADAVLSLLADDPENLFVVLTARELNPVLNIIARTEVASSESRMLRAGADSIISLYASAGRRVAVKALAAKSNTLDRGAGNGEAGEEPQWVPVGGQSELAGCRVGAANSILDGTIIGIRRDGKDVLMPSSNVEILAHDELLVSAKPLIVSQNIKQKSSEKKIVLIDDNPVIRRLYTRLFQKAGFNILTAENGQKGLVLVARAKPDVAVIDFHLPDMNGIQISRKIRENRELDHVKLLMFTGDDEEQTRNEALKIGVDSVVVKSPDASEIINMVRQSLEEA